MSSLGDKLIAAEEENATAEVDLAVNYQQAIADQRALADAAANPVPEEKRVL